MGEKERYARHLILEEIGEPGQEKLKRAKVLVVGAGGLGSPVLLYLTAAGIGRIGILDNDIVSESNLQRQILYDTQCLGALKVEVAARKLQALNPYTTIVPYAQRLTSENTFIIAEYDLVIDATDNLPSRYLIDEACVRYGKPFVYGSICEFKGQVSVFNYQGGPTYREPLRIPLMPTLSFSNHKASTGALPGVVGSIQANEAIKLILGSQDTLSGKLLLIDLLKGSFQTMNFIN